MAQRAIVFIGNPGSGKSTIINGLSGKQEAKAGMAEDGKSVTKKMQRVIAGDIVYIDTPGLCEADKEGESEAMGEIQKALQTGLPTNIVAVLRAHQGRLVKEDLATALTVLQALGNTVPSTRGKAVFVVNFLPKKAWQAKFTDQMTAIILRASNEIGGLQRVLWILEHPAMSNEDYAEFPPDTLPHLPKYITSDTAVVLPSNLKLRFGGASYKGFLDKIEVWLRWFDRKAEGFKRFLSSNGLDTVAQVFDVSGPAKPILDFMNSNLD